MRMLLLFGKAVGRHWLALLTGSLLIAFVGGLEHWRQESLTPWVYTGLVVLFLLVACFLAWRDVHTTLETLTKGINDGAIELSRLRKRGIDELSAKPLSGEDEVPGFIEDHDRWRDDVLDVLKANFSEPIVSSFESLGALRGNYRSSIAVNDQHNHRLLMVSRQLEIIEELIKKHAPTAPR